ncbi:g6904 [Coccomyxa elongata]
MQPPIPTNPTPHNPDLGQASQASQGFGVPSDGFGCGGVHCLIASNATPQLAERAANEPLAIEEDSRTLVRPSSPGQREEEAFCPREARLSRGFEGYTGLTAVRRFAERVVGSVIPGIHRDFHRVGLR